MYTTTGTVEAILDLQEFPSGFTKQILVVNDGGNEVGEYQQLIPFEFIKDKTKLLENLQVGQAVEVSFDLRGNEYKGKYYPGLQGWKIVAGEHSQEQQATVSDGDEIPF